MMATPCLCVDDDKQKSPAKHTDNAGVTNKALTAPVSDLQPIRSHGGFDLLPLA